LNTRISREEAREILYTLSPLRYIRHIGFTPYEWQAAVMESGHKRKVINGARQAGKSTIVSAKPCHTARFYPKSISLIIAATEKQAFLDMEKVKEFISHDSEYPKIKRRSDELITLENGSWIMVAAATEKGARGPSAPRLILLDEASRIDDIVYRSGVIPMLTNNPECELVNISTPNGKSGFFYESFNNPRWERYEVKSPWEVVDIEFRLEEGESGEAYGKRRAGAGILAWHSPRHADKEEQEFNLNEMGPRMYRQEYRCEFVEPEDQVFSYEEIERMTGGAEVESVRFDAIGEAEAIEI
jgi:hypothetical protein